MPMISRLLNKHNLHQLQPQQWVENHAMSTLTIYSCSTVYSSDHKANKGPRNVHTNTRIRPLQNQVSEPFEIKKWSSITKSY